MRWTTPVPLAPGERVQVFELRLFFAVIVFIPEWMCTHTHCTIMQDVFLTVVHTQEVEIP